jgi:spore coat protein CotF
LQNNPMTDKEIMTDVLTSQKHITGTYSLFANECKNQELLNDMMCILNEEHTIQHNVFTEMEKRGWYAPPAAEQQKINEAKTKFEGISATL